MRPVVRVACLLLSLASFAPLASAAGDAGVCLPEAVRLAHARIAVAAGALTGSKGVAAIDVDVDADARVRVARMGSSSGYRAVDEALFAAAGNWRVDSTCAKKLDGRLRVKLAYRRPGGAGWLEAAVVGVAGRPEPRMHALNDPGASR